MFKILKKKLFKFYIYFILILYINKILRKYSIKITKDLDVQKHNILIIHTILFITLMKL